MKTNIICLSFVCSYSICGLRKTVLQVDIPGRPYGSEPSSH